MVQIIPVENGFVITAHYDLKKNGIQDMNTVIQTALGGLSDGGDPTLVFKKVMDQVQLKDAVRRKPVEHHVAKNLEEMVRLLTEILGSMK